MFESLPPRHIEHNDTSLKEDGEGTSEQFYVICNVCNFEDKSNADYYW